MSSLEPWNAAYLPLIIYVLASHYFIRRQNQLINSSCSLYVVKSDSGSGNVKLSSEPNEALKGTSHFTADALQAVKHNTQN